MRLMIAGFSHETNTFSPVPTPLQRFCLDGRTLLSGTAAINLLRNTGTGIGGFIDVAERAGAQFDVPVVAIARPSGPVDREAFETVCRLLTEAISATPYDGLMLALHGAMVVEGIQDGEGELLTRIRQVYPDGPIAVSLDMHANLFPEMIEQSTVISGFHLYPHLDEAETARRAGSILVKALRGEVAPVTAWGNVPMLPHTLKQGTHEWPNKDIQALAASWEADGRALSASVFTGFPMADVSNAGLSAVVVTNGDETEARAMVDTLLDMAWEARGDFRFDSEPLEDSIARAKAAAQNVQPIFLLDHCDNCASGGSMDTTAVLAEIIRQDLDDVAFFGIFDPEAVRAAEEAGVGAEVELDIGGKAELPALATPNLPIRVRAVVKTLSAGSFKSQSPASLGLKISMGKTAVIDTGTVEIVLLSRQIEPYAIEMLSAIGIDPRRKRFVAIKSRLHWRADLGPLAAEVVECSGLGVCTSDYSQLRFQHVRRPIYPLDVDAPRA